MNGRNIILVWTKEENNLPSTIKIYWRISQRNAIKLVAQIQRINSVNYDNEKIINFGITVIAN